jgi:hypothetical protein
MGAHSPIKIKGEQWGNGWLDGRNDHQPLSLSDHSKISETLLTYLPSELPSADALRFISELQKQIQSAPHCE